MAHINEYTIAQRFQELTYLHLFTDCFMMISPQSSEQTQLVLLNAYVD